MAKSKKSISNKGERNSKKRIDNKRMTKTKRYERTYKDLPLKEWDYPSFETKQGNLYDHNSWGKIRMISNDGCYFITVVDVITTHKNHEQQFFGIPTFHHVDATPLEIECNYLQSILEELEDIDPDLLYDLWKVSTASCVRPNKYGDKIYNNFTKFADRQNGKFIFGRFLREGSLEAMFVENDPRIGRFDY